VFGGQLNVDNKEMNAAASRVRDWIHETPLSLCDTGSDTCPDWDLAYAIVWIVLGLPLPEREQRVIDQTKGK